MTQQASTRKYSFACLVVLALGAPAAAGDCNKRAPTAAASLGPHDFSSAPADNNLWHEGDAGEPLSLHLRVLNSCGEPLPGALVHLLHANQDGEHDPQRWRAQLHADEQGVVKVVTVYPGYAGSLARHIHFIISHPGYRRLVTRLYFKNDPAVAGHEPADLAIVLEEVRLEGKTRWVGGYEFVLTPSSQVR